MAIKAGCQWLTIHGRTRMQGYTPPAYWEPIGKIKKMFPQTPIIANGEIWTMDDFKRCQDETQCIHFMMGRGLLADPLLVFEVAKELGLEVEKIKDSQKIEFIK